MKSFRRLVSNVQEGSLYVLLFLLPFSKAAVESFFGVLLATWLIARLDPATRRESVWFTPQFAGLRRALLAFLLVCALSIAVSQNPMLSLNGVVNKWAEYLMLFVIATDIAARRPVAERLPRVLAAAAIFVLFEAVTQERYGWGFFRNYRLDFFRRTTGPYENPIDLATFLIVILPPLITATVLNRAHRSRALGWGVLVAALMICLVRTEAVGAWLGLGLGLILMALRHAPLRRYLAAALAVAVLAGGFFIMKGKTSTQYSFSEIGTWDRWMMWQAAFGMIKDRPILGHGVNTFMSKYLEYWVGGERQPRYAHNCYLQVTAETGILGLVTFVWLLALLLRHVAAGIADLPPPDRLRLIGLAGGLVGFLAQAGLDTNFYALRQAALFWTMAGLAVGMTARLPAPRRG